MPRAYHAHVLGIVPLAVVPGTDSWQVILRVSFTWGHRLPPQYRCRLFDAAVGCAVLLASEPGCPPLGGLHLESARAALPGAVRTGDPGSCAAVIRGLTHAGVQHVELQLKLGPAALDDTDPRSGDRCESLLSAPPPGSAAHRMLAWARNLTELQTNKNFELQALVCCALACSHSPRVHLFLPARRLTHPCSSVRRLGPVFLASDGMSLWTLSAAYRRACRLSHWEGALEIAEIQGGGFLAYGALAKECFVLLDLDLRRFPALSPPAMPSSVLALQNGDLPELHWLSSTGSLWRQCLGHPPEKLPQAEGIPDGWGDKEKWLLSRASGAWLAGTPWVLACGASPPVGPGFVRNGIFSSMVERLCLRTESFLAGVLGPRELAEAADHVAPGAPATGPAEFRAGLVCFEQGASALGRAPTCLCAGRVCVEAWLGEPASALVFAEIGHSVRIAYVDRGGYLVRTTCWPLTSRAARVANSSLHDVLLSTLRPVGGESELLVSCHSNLLGSSWRPQSAPACPLLLADGSWVVLPPAVPYVLCSCWDGTLRWCTPLPVQARCCASSGGSLFVGTQAGILVLAPGTGAIVRIIPDLCPLYLVVGPPTKRRGSTLAGAEEDGSLVMLEEEDSEV